MTLARALLVFSTLLVLSLAAYSALLEPLPRNFSLLLAALYLGLLIWGHRSPQQQMFAQQLFVVPGKRKSLALTIDGGPHPQITPKVLEALEQYKSKATFFLEAAQVEKYPALAVKIESCGHEVGLLGVETRAGVIGRSPRWLAQQICCDAALLVQAGLASSRWYRHPGGRPGPRVAQATRIAQVKLVGALARVPSVSSHGAPSKLDSKFAKSLRGGAVLQVAVSGKSQQKKGQVESLVLMLEACARRELIAVTVSELLFGNVNSELGS